ncbi:sugar phosphate isomerase/epimerase family protein [Litoreibacter albidus]|uniref:Xylose isomerase-like TIM barrel n=1 Tax=Litoreibacter albidus TaxID=670155 RepID=A0A1H3ASW4_9RHOB|nr:TIM barrel protein [Litoreibacter albidus]SDX32830.1 Xylose isomerase-like TIM barrel [Litoreibacter albidus]
MIAGLGSYAFRWSVGHKDRRPEAPMTAMDVLDVAAEHDLGVVQYADNLPLHKLGEGELDALATAARAKGIALELGTQSFDAEEVRRYIEIGQRIGAGILRVALDAPDAKRPVPELAAEFVALLPALKAANIRLAIENHFNFPSRRVVELLKQIDDEQVGVCLDVANSICAGEWPMETVEILAPYTINLHLKDYVIQPDPYGVGFSIHGAPLGTGRTDIAAVLDAVGRRDMSVIYEHWLHWPGAFDAARKAEHNWTNQSVKVLKASVQSP